MAAPFRIERPATTKEGAALPSAGSGDTFQSYLDRLFKMIPGEVVSMYLVGSGMIPADEKIGHVIWLIVALITTVALRAKYTADPTLGQTTQWGPVAIASVAFLIWAYTLGGPFVAYGIHIPWVGSLLVLGWTFFLPYFYKGPAS